MNELRKEALFNEIKGVLEAHRCIYTLDEDGDGQQLVDLLSAPNDETIETGAKELYDIAESFYVFFVDKLKQEHTEQANEHIAEIESKDIEIERLMKVDAQMIGSIVQTKTMKLQSILDGIRGEVDSIILQCEDLYGKNKDISPDYLAELLKSIEEGKE